MTRSYTAVARLSAFPDSPPEADGDLYLKARRVTRSVPGGSGIQATAVPGRP